MTSMDERPDEADDFHRQAAAAAPRPENTEILSPEKTLRVLQELRVHQIELEMQNEELRRAQVELDATRARYFDLYDLAPVGYCTISAQGLALEANLAAAGLLGVSRTALVGQPISRFILKEDQDSYYLHRKRLFETGERQTWELRMAKKDGTIFWVHLALGASQGADGAPVFRVVMSDITERKHAEERQRHLEAQLQQAQKMESLGSLAGGVAHDMNNVLGAILGLASANLEIQPADGSAHRAFDTISKAAIRGGELVKGLLSFARQSPAEDQILDVNAILREEVRLLERTTLSKVRLKMDLAADIRPISGDVSALTHAFMNLCVNAVDAMPDTGTLTFRTLNVDKDWIEVQVEDMGSGMAKDVLEKAMDPFFTTKGHGRGTGLGLSIVYSTVKAHHGQMEIQSEPGQGTRVTMRFPACEPVPQVTEPRIEHRSESSPRTLKVLVVDDDDLIQSSMQAVLEILGNVVALAPSGEEGLAKLEAGFEADVVILDMNMPGLGGAGTLPRLRALRPTLPVLLATGRVDRNVLDLVAAHPGVTLLSKPFSMKDLKKHLEALG